ncbi:MAG: ABC transporter substrate-binding protein [Reyranella sp.]|uniref:ABC transporter substrate-binding protein n=1 Tax=Reyranella sp. TaxID=1929291 RepID=UPI0025DA8ED8|nr:ABC transporter substrate-binding protein [Reyranella sp.]MBR2819578.1 ABC transporter substrate-binding protein [Reyranella sp.]
MKRRVLGLALACVLGVAAGGVGMAQAQTTLRVVNHSDLKILDPIWTTAYIVRNHGYMIYDTLFALDENLEVKPQMVDAWKVSDDKLTWTFTLRDGLEFHDGTPVTSADVIPSLKRWSVRDPLGQILWAKVVDVKAVDPKTFQIILKAPTGVMLQALGKPSGNPFIMPKKVVETDPGKQIDDYIGSGPFIFKKDEWKPGDKTVYVKNPKYKPRAEPPSGLAGGKIAKVDRVEWVAMPDQQTAVNALLKGEIDMIESPQHDLFKVMEADPNIKLVNLNRWGNQYIFRFNQLFKPFDNAKIRQAVIAAFNQKDFLDGVIGDPRYYKVCKAMFMCDTPYATTAGMEKMYNSDFALAKELLKEGGYDGTSVVLMHSTDLYVLTNLAPVAKALMEKAGLKVDMVSMDWQTLVSRRARKGPPDKGGWNAFLTSSAAVDIVDPLANTYINAVGENAWFGWPKDDELLRLRAAFADETDPVKQKELATAMQVRVSQSPTHGYVGQWYAPVALRKNVTGSLVSPVTIFWNIEKK